MRGPAAILAAAEYVARSCTDDSTRQSVYSVQISCIHCAFTDSAVVVWHDQGQNISGEKFILNHLCLPAAPRLLHSFVLLHPPPATPSLLLGPVLPTWTSFGRNLQRHWSCRCACLSPCLYRGCSQAHLRPVFHRQARHICTSIRTKGASYQAR